MPRVIECVVEYEAQPPCKTAEEMELLCCEVLPALQCCELSHHGSCNSTNNHWYGYTHAELLDKYHPGLSDYEKNFIRIELKPRNHPCGYLVTEYDTSPTDCCERVVALEYDWSQSAEVISVGGSGHVFVVNGKGPFIWTIQGTGFEFKDEGATVTTYSRTVEVEGTDSSCGAADITVTDLCGGSVTGAIRSTDGTWALNDDETCGLTNVPEYIEEIINGKSKRTEWWCSGGDCNPSDGDNCNHCGDVGCDGNAILDCDPIGIETCRHPDDTATGECTDSCFVRGTRQWEWGCV